MTDIKRRMSNKHEDHLAEVLGARRTPGSGNGFANPMDARQSRYDQKVAFAVDGKSTLSNSISVTRDMLKKAREQAHGERPMLALRWYHDERLKSYEDWYLIREDELLELLDLLESL